jgi:molybdopterin molybdotransferase
LQDDKDILLSNIRDILNNFDVVIMSGGVSAGKFDFIPEVMRILEVKELLYFEKQND